MSGPYPSPSDAARSAVPSSLVKGHPVVRRVLLRLFLVLCMVPLFGVGTAGVAAAATSTSYGGRADWSFVDGNAKGTGGEGFGQTPASCTGTAQWVTETVEPLPMSVRIRGRYKCDIAVPWDDDPNSLTNTNTSVYFAGDFDNGDPCVYFASASGDPLVGLSYETDSNNEGCDAKQVCVESVGTWTRAVFSDVTYVWEGCHDLNLGPQPRPVAGGSCVAGMPTLAKPSVRPSEYGGDIVYRKTELTFVLDQAMGFHQGWSWEARWPVAGTSGPVPDVNRQAWSNGTTTGTYGSWSGTNFIGNDQLSQPGGMPVGIWVWATGVQGNPRPHNSYTYGQNDPANCHFYFGPKFYDDPTSDLDDPSGPMGQPVDVGGEPPDMTPPEPGSEDTTGEECSFKITDPASWLSGGMCAAVGVLKLIWETLGQAVAAIGRLAGDIVDGILDGFEAAFVPEDGFLDGRIDRLQAAWSNTSPSKYLTALTDLRLVGGGNGCSGLPLDLTLPGGVRVRENIGAACSGAMANTATIVQLVLTGTVVLGGIVSCVRILGAGLGWHPGIGRTET